MYEGLIVNKESSKYTDWQIFFTIKSNRKFSTKTKKIQSKNGNTLESPFYKFGNGRLQTHLLGNWV